MLLWAKVMKHVVEVVRPDKRAQTFLICQSYCQKVIKRPRFPHEIKMSNICSWHPVPVVGPLLCWYHVVWIWYQFSVPLHKCLEFFLGSFTCNTTLEIIERKLRCLAQSFTAATCNIWVSVEPHPTWKCSAWWTTLSNYSRCVSQCLAAACHYFTISVPSTENSIWQPITVVLQWVYNQGKWLSSTNCTRLLIALRSSQTKMHRHIHEQTNTQPFQLTRLFREQHGIKAISIFFFVCKIPFKWNKIWKHNGLFDLHLTSYLPALHLATHSLSQTIKVEARFKDQYEKILGAIQPLSDTPSHTCLHLPPPLPHAFVSSCLSTSDTVPWVVNFKEKSITRLGQHVRWYTWCLFGGRQLY